MFEFYGRLSDECIKRFSKKQNKKNAIIFAPFVLIACIISLIFGVYHLNEFYYSLGFTLLLFVINIFILFVPAKSAIFTLPQRIIFNIQENNISVLVEGLNNPSIRPIEKRITDIKKIIDFGEYYYITLKGFNNDIIVQKNLLIAGTLNDFELNFKGKIIKKSEI